VLIGSAGVTEPVGNASVAAVASRPTWITANTVITVTTATSHTGSGPGRRFGVADRIR
jgi:hypothetical protein